MRIVILGLSITSSWGNGHATTYRGLERALADRGHDVLFLERDQPWYAANRDLPRPPYGMLSLYESVDELRRRFAGAVKAADLVIVGSYVPDGIAVGSWVAATAMGVTAFYDIDTPVTLAALEQEQCAYLSAALIPRYGLYLSFTGGPTLQRIEEQYGARLARPLYCGVDPELYFPAGTPARGLRLRSDGSDDELPTGGGRLFSSAGAAPAGAMRDRDLRPAAPRYDLGYMGTYSADRQPMLERLLLEPARRLADRRFVVAGPQFPDAVAWPANVTRVTHLSPAEHRGFYISQRFTLNLTRGPMVEAGFSPSVRLFEAAACATPVISDRWPGLETFFVPGREILVANTTEQMIRLLRELPEQERVALGVAARDRVLGAHTAAHRVAALEGYVEEARRF